MNILNFNLFFFFKQKTAYEMRISDWSSDVCSSDLLRRHLKRHHRRELGVGMILPHRDPGVGDDDIRPFHRLACIADAARATLPQREIGLGRLIPLRARRNDLDLHPPGAFHERGEPVVSVAPPTDLEAGDPLAPSLYPQTE